MANSPVIPWDYYQTIRKQQQADDDPIGKAMSVLHADDTHAAVLNGGDPGKVARANQLAPQIGEHPALIEDRLDDVQRGLNAGALSKVAQDHPGLGQHLAANPRTAVVAQGDHQSLGLLGRAWEFTKGIPGSLQAGYYGTAASLSDLWTSLDEAVLSIASPNTMTAKINAGEQASASYRARQDLVRPKSDSFVVRSALQGVESIAPSLLAAGAGLLTRNPNVAAGMMGVTTGAPAYREALRAGKGTGDALRYAIEQGGVEALTERMPAGEWLDALTKRTPVGKAILRSLAEEIPGEQVATVLQDFSEWVNLHPEKPFSAYLEERPAAALATAIATVTGTSAQVGATRVLQGVVDSSVRTVAKVAAGRREAEAAHGEAAVIDAMGRAAQNSELRKRDPEAFNGLIADLAEKNGAHTVFVPAEALSAYMQSDSYDQYTDPMERYRAQIEEAAVTGGDVVLPADFALGTLPGTPAWNALKDDMRLSAGGMSAREADDLHGRLDEVMGQIGEVAGKQAAQTMAEETAHAKIVERVRGMLENAGFTPEAAATQAELIALKETVRAARMGKQLTGDEFGTEVRQVLPPALAEARAADETDLVINALRKGGTAGSQGGQSLLDWIASRGGIEDKGGDLTAMGADKWHREKKFRRKLLKPYEEAQGNLIGGAHNPNSIESTFDAAVSAGYFPELLAQRENGTGYADALDVNAFKAAIADELAGRPRFAEEAKTDPYRAAADELATLLGQRGIDPEGLSDAELRSVIDQLGQAEDGGRGFDQITPAQALETNVPVEMPSDPLFAEAVENTPGAEITPDGLLIDLVRFQKPEQEGAQAIRTGVFYLPAKSADVRHYRNAKTGYGGAERFAGETLIRRPLFVKGATGGAAPEQAYKQLMGKDAFAEMSRAVTQVITRGGNYMRPDPALKLQLIEEFLDQYAPESSGDGAQLERVSREGNTLRYALQELAVAHAVRNAGYDAVVGYSKGKAGARISEVFDVREQTFPARGAESYVHDAFGRTYNQAAYHGSPHIFDRFSLDHIGTGEGAQAYGWGLYFAGRKEIAQHYRDMLSGKWTPRMESAAAKALGVGVGVGYETPVLSALTMSKDIEGFRADLKQHVARGLSKSPNGYAHKEAELIAESLKSGKLDAFYRQFEKEVRGRLYEVEIPEDDEYLLWDKPLSEQPEKVKAALEKMKGGDKAAEDLSNDELFAALGGYEQTFGDKEKTGQGFYKELSADLARKNGQKDADEGNGWTVVNPTVHYNDKLASQFLHDLGIAGIKYLDGGSRSDGTGTHNYVVFDDSRVSIQQYEQAYGDGPRGRIRFERTRTVIELFQSRNLSTLTHELGHQWLEDLRVDAESPDAPDQVKADWQTVQDWFAANGQPLTDGVIPVEAHELFARGIERYFMEGKSPSSALTRVFEAIRGWMLAVYRTVDKLRAPISPEIREVFDRMLATDDEIAQARERQALEPLFKDAASIGMTEPEFQAYTRQVQGARDEANATLLAKTMAAIRRREEKAFRDERAGVWADEAERLDQSPILSSLAAMKDAPISKEWLVDRMGMDVLDLLPKRVPPLYRDGGAHPDAIAEENGFASGEEMVKSILGVEAQHRAARESGDKRTMRQRMIDQAADAEMTRRHGDDPFNSGAIEAEALAAVNGELQGELLATEVRALARKTGKRPTPYALARQWAREKVRGGTVALEASPAAIQRHARNVAKAGRAAEAAMMKGDNEAALVAKQQQMVASALLAEAKAAADEVSKAQARMAKVAKAKTMASVDQDYLERAQSLLEGVSLRPRSQRSIDRQAKWEAWAAARRAEGYDVIVPDSFAASLEGTHWSRMTVEALLGLDAAVSQVMHLGRMKQTLLDNKEQRDFEAVVAEAVGGMGNIDGPPPKGLQERNSWDALKSKVLSADAALLKMETVFDWLDGGNPDGVFNRIVFRPIAEAQGRAQDMQKDYMGRIRDLFAAVPEEQVQRWGDKMQTPFVDKFSGLPFSPVRHRLIAMALNIGNEGNLQRLSDGYGWNPQAIENYLNETLTAEEWQFVQGVWDTIETLWPEIEALERRVNGVAPDKVEPRSFETPHGTVRGGYYPAIYDSALSMMAEDRTSSPESVLYEPGTTKATTRSGATKARADKVSEPILLDLGVINRHLGEVIHDITHREAVMQAWKFMSNRRIASAIDEALGQEIRKQLRPWVKFVANSWAMERAGNEGLGKFFSKLRANATIVGMGFRVTTMVTQIAGYANSVEVVGEAAMAKAIAQTSASPVETFRFVMERSTEMRHRMDSMDRDLGAELARLEASNPATKAAHAVVEGKKFFFHGIGYMDRMVSVPTWLAGYNKALEAGLDEEAAAYAGDKAVRVSQGAGAPKDLAAVQRGTGKFGEALKLFTTFYSYFSAMYQRERSLGRDVMGRDARMPRNMPRLVARAWWLLIVPPLMTEVLRAAVTGDGGPDDDEWWAQWTMRKLLANVVGPIPFVRDVFEPAWNKAVKGKFFSPSSTPIQRAMDSITRAAGDVGNLARGEDTKHATKDILETAGYATGLVPGQIASATQFLVDVGQGDADPETVRDWATGLTTGKMPKED